ncbi:hypothetical protein [Herbiconiux ginsengi]|uniref:Uncharacterized protein n=1 Tax=Herbiconiux ginsengi TaxID=381665 RepID=A0A1H3SSK0_9MICO|nr:hypothetical protein [Herbiconiux ginsengi]SDZ40677.1 hypothetical protein SAMN05216554_3629 [Herbiconiux ginsengi]
MPPESPFSPPALPAEPLPWVESTLLAAQPRRHRRRRAIVVTGVVLASLGLVAGAFWGISVLAVQQKDLAVAVLRTAVDEQAAAQKTYDARARYGASLAERAGSVVARAEFNADTTPDAAHFRLAYETIAALDDETPEDNGAGAAIARADDDDSAGYRPPWEVFTEAAADRDLTHDVVHDRDALIAAAKEATDAQDWVDDTEAAYFSAVAARGTSDIAANTLATKQSQVALTRLIEQADDPAMSTSRDGAFLSSFVAAENALVASQAAEAAELADPALAVRREIEDYARSLSNEMTLDFVWAPEVNGKGEGWLSGTAETYQSDGGWAVITLNYGVEEDWGLDENPRALVAHEVGHAQAHRPACSALFTGPVFGSDDEMWATAWSISLGFDLPGSGIEAYGRPSDEQIAVAGQCR